MGADLDFVSTVRAALAAVGDAERAGRQRAYMRSALPFHGVPAALLRTTLRPLLATYDPVDRGSHEATVRALWDGATHREDWYAAIALVRLRRLRTWLDPAALPLLRHLVTTGAWWDVVDDVATHPVADVLAAHHDEAAPVVWAWAVDDDPWVRRTAVLCQVPATVRTDVDLLRHVVAANVDDPSPWLRKAVGWALRAHAGTDPDWVRAEVGRYGARMSAPSRREALRHIGRSPHPKGPSTEASAPNGM